jgi:hypothetical protein
MRRERTALIAIGGIAMACAMTVTLAAMSAQMELKTTEVKNFEVVSVHGNIVVAKTDAGAKEYTVTDDFRFTIDGKKIGVHDLKPGMKGTATVTTTTTVTPMYLTEVKKGEVTKVFGNSVVVHTDNAFKLFTEEDVKNRGFTVMRNGQPVDFSQLKVGDNITATIVTSMPPREVTKQEVDAMISSPPPAMAAPAPAPATPPAAAAGPPASATGTPPPSTPPASTPPASTPPASAPPASAPPASTPPASAAPPATTAPPSAAPASAPPSSTTPPATDTEAPGMSSTLIIGGIGVLLLIVLIVALSARKKKA